MWTRYRKYLCRCPGLGMTLDISCMKFDDAFIAQMQPRMQIAYDDMAKVEAGEIANPDEQRMVGHYWLRDAALAPNDTLRQKITDNLSAIADLAKAIHGKTICPPSGGRFTELLLIGIGGSALGPQLVADALGAKRDKMRIHFMDNTDPDGIERTLEALGGRLKSTLVMVISKSGGTPEPRNAMLLATAAFAAKGLDFAAQAVAVTGEGSKLDGIAKQEGWLKRLPMWDWVGGRTSVMAGVGLAPAALQGVDYMAMLDGAKKMDQLTRKTQTKQNPAALLALMWHYATGGEGGAGGKDMVILPYKDRLLLMSRYLQQLVMESLGKKHDLDGNVVHQGISVYGNKGSTDQHAYVQQLRDGLNNFFATFIVVLQDRTRADRHVQLEVEDGVTAGDFLNGFWQGTREALYEGGRESITITLDKLDARAVGSLIALYERAVSFYASLVNVNAYHQPGVEAGKKAAADVLDVQSKAVAHLKAHADEQFTVEKLADNLGEPDQTQCIYHILEHLAANKRLVRKRRNAYIYLPA
jgi:glucose-6-phosphate isomerase